MWRCSSLGPCWQQRGSVLPLKRVRKPLGTFQQGLAQLVDTEGSLRGAGQGWKREAGGEVTAVIQAERRGSSPAVPGWR